MSEETIKVELPEIPGFEPYKVGETIDQDNCFMLCANGAMIPRTIAHVVEPNDPIYFRRIGVYRVVDVVKPENPPLPTREDCENWGYEFPTVCDVPTEYNCDAWVLDGGTVFSSITNNPEPGPEFESRRWLLRKKQVPLSFENWQGPLSIKARKKSDKSVVRLDAYPFSVRMCPAGGSENGSYLIPYETADRHYETLDGGKIGRG